MVRGVLASAQVYSGECRTEYNNEEVAEVAEVAYAQCILHFLKAKPFQSFPSEHRPKWMTVALQKRQLADFRQRIRPRRKMACRRKPTVPSPPEGRLLVANGHGGWTTHAGLTFEDDNWDVTGSFSVPGHAEARTFRLYAFPADFPSVLTNSGSVAATWTVTGTVSAGTLSFLTAAAGGLQVSVTFPYVQEEGWEAFVQATLGSGTLSTYAVTPWARASGGLIEIGVKYPIQVPAGETGKINYAVTFVRLP
jgi:hypothetical protein